MEADIFEKLKQKRAFLVSEMERYKVEIDHCAQEIDAIDATVSVLNDLLAEDTQIAPKVLPKVVPVNQISLYDKRDKNAVTKEYYARRKTDERVKDLDAILEHHNLYFGGTSNTDKAGCINCARALLDLIDVRHLDADQLDLLASLISDGFGRSIIATQQMFVRGFGKFIERHLKKEDGRDFIVFLRNNGGEKIVEDINDFLTADKSKQKKNDKVCAYMKRLYRDFKTRAVEGAA